MVFWFDRLRPGMSRQPFRRSLLIFQEKPPWLYVVTHVVRRIGIDKIVWLESQLLEVNGAKFRLSENSADTDRNCPHILGWWSKSKGHVECSAQVEPTEAVETGSIEIVEELGCFFADFLLKSDQLIEAFAMLVINHRWYFASIVMLRPRLTCS